MPYRPSGQRTASVATPPTVPLTFPLYPSAGLTYRLIEVLESSARAYVALATSCATRDFSLLYPAVSAFMLAVS